MVTDLQISQANFHCKHAWTREELTDIKKRYLAKESMASIGENLGMSAISVARVLSIMGVTPRARGKVPALTPEQKVRALILLEKQTQQQVAEQLGVSRSIVQKLFSEHRDSVNG